MAEGEKRKVSFNLSLANWREQSLLNKTLTVIVIAAILVAIGTVGYVIAAPKVGEKFTELYILGSENKAEGYPEELVVGEEVNVTVGIINREYEVVSYRLEVEIDGVKSGEAGTVVLDHNEKWEGIASFTPRKSGRSQKVEFLLYRQGQSEAYRSVYLWVNVRQ